jgi:hypothetical protein
MGREKPPISQDEFEKYKIKLFAKANDELKSFAKKLADYCWGLDEFAVVQEWGSEKDALIVFGVPPDIRRVKNAKNYFSIYKVMDSFDQKLKCEVCFSIDDSRPEKLRKYDTENKLSTSTINQCEGMFSPSDYDYVLKLIDAARACRVVE